MQQVGGLYKARMEARLTCLSIRPAICVSSVAVLAEGMSWSVARVRLT